MKNQGGETKAAPRPASSSKMSSGLVLEEGDSPEAAAPLEGGESPGPGARRSLPAADGSADSPSSEAQETRAGGFRAWKESGCCFLCMRVGSCIQLFLLL